MIRWLGLPGCPELAGVVVVVVVEPDGRPAPLDDWSDVAAVDVLPSEVVAVVVVADDAALWLASSLTSVAWADARLAWAEVTQPEAG